jgi:hypothetical protein
MDFFKHNLSHSFNRLALLYWKVIDLAMTYNCRIKYGNISQHKPVGNLKIHHKNVFYY